MPGSDQDDIEHGRLLNELFDRRLRGEVGGATPAGADSALAAELNECLEVAADLRPSCDGIDNLVERGLLRRCDDQRYPAELGPYRIVDYIGRGGMGIVLKAYEPELDRLVALKILRPDLASDPAALTRFTREAKAAAALRHPNIVTIYAVGEHSGTHFIAMEYVAGPSLADVIRRNVAALTEVKLETASPSAEATPETVPPSRWDHRGVKRGTPDPHEVTTTLPQPLPWREGSIPSLDTATIREIFRQLLSALAAAHEAGLIHRDVKSSNILLDKGLRDSGIEGLRRRQPTSSPEFQSPAPANPQSLNPSIPQSPTADPAVPAVKLADFGLARLAGSQTTLTKADSILGTPEYMSPEQARGDADIDHRTDLYSAGVVLYEMLTGRTPFKADKSTAVIHQIIHTDPPDPRTINNDADPALGSLAMRLMAKSPQDRMETAIAALAACESATAVRVPERTRRLYRRLATAALVLVLGGPTVALWRSHSRGREITECRVDPDNGLSIQVRRGNGAEWEQFCKFPAIVALLTDVELVAPYESGRNVIVVGLQRPFDGANVFAFDQYGRRLWKTYLHDDANRQWPDCTTNVDWSCNNIAVGDLNDIPGQEIVVAAGERLEYPTRVSVVDPRTGDCYERATFWNFGKIDRVIVAPDFFDDGGAAIIAWGPNNKLDGFDRPAPGDDKPVACWDYVSAIVVLDPREMNGLGPPRTNRRDLAAMEVARPYAYAILNLPQVPGLAHKPLDGTLSDERSSTEQAAGIADVVVERDVAGGPGATRLVLTIARHPPVEGGATLAVDRQLGFVSVLPNNTESAGKDKDFWRRAWRVVIRNGEYVSSPEK